MIYKVREVLDSYRGEHKRTIYLAVEPGVVVDINNAVSTSAEAGLDEGVVFSKVVRVEVSALSVVGQKLPSNGETEDVHLVIVNEVLHLAKSVDAFKQQNKSFIVKNRKEIG